MHGRILILTPGGFEHGGGIGRQMGYLCRAWAASVQPPDVRVIDSHGAGSRWLSPFFLASAILRIIVEAIRAEIAVIHINVAGRGSTWRKLIATPICAALRLPIVLHLHDYDYPRFVSSLPGMAQAAIRAMFKLADRVVVLGHADGDYVTRILGVAAERVIILHNAAPRPTVTERPPAQPHRILFLGGLGPRKGVPELLEALASPTLQALPWTAVLAGGGPVAEYRQRAAELGLQDRVTLPGWVDGATAARLLSEATLLTLPSHAEGMAMSVLEGLAYGLPIVCTRVGALGEVIIDEMSGLFVPVGNAGMLAATLARVLSDPDLRHRLSVGAQSRFAEGFEIDRYAERMLALYQSIAITRRNALVRQRS